MEYNDIKLSITLQEDMMSHKRNAKLLSESRGAQVCFVLDVGRNDHIGSSSSSGDQRM